MSCVVSNSGVVVDFWEYVSRFLENRGGDGRCGWTVGCEGGGAFGCTLDRVCRGSCRLRIWDILELFLVS